MKEVRVHRLVKRQLDECTEDIKEELAQIFRLLADGKSLAMPLSRPMPNVAHGVHELRLHDRFGQVRIFYYTKLQDRILIFHFYKKKTRSMPKNEIKLAQKRLKEIL